jgi:hypothetical protein
MFFASIVKARNMKTTRNSPDIIKNNNTESDIANYKRLVSKSIYKASIAR